MESGSHNYNHRKEDGLEVIIPPASPPSSSAILVGSSSTTNSLSPVALQKSLPLHINTMTTSFGSPSTTTTSTTTDVEALTPSGVERTYSSNANTMFLSNGNSVIKKRVWTPVSEAKYNHDVSPASHSSFGEVKINHLINFHAWT